MQLERDMRRELEEYNALVAKIADLPQGPVRLALKRKRNNIAGLMVCIRQAMIEEEVRSDNPRHVPRLEFKRNQPVKFELGAPVIPTGGIYVPEP